jgi:hypothetical protein
LTEYLDEEETTRVYETREPYSSIEAYPPALTKGIYIWQTTAPLVCATLLTIAGTPPPPPPPIHTSSYTLLSGWEEALHKIESKFQIS